MSHTKGPWEFYNGEVTTKQEQGRSYRRIAAVQDYGLGSDPEVDEANARLIAAAPDLLAAMTLILDRLATSPMQDDELAATIRAAIKKAKGL
jgi:hypothetical protein